MDSRIILTQADFSANNIGRIVELSDLTKKILTKQTQYVEGDEEAVALDTFLTNLTSGGFIGGESPLLYGLFIPALASSHDELLYNLAKLDASGYPVNGMSDEEINAEGTNKALSLVNDNSNHVIAFAPVDVDTEDNYKLQSLVKTELLSDKVGESMPDFSLCTYLIDFPGTNSFILESKSINYKVRFNTENINIYQNMPSNNSVACNISGSSKIKGFSGLSYKDAEKWEALLDYGTLETPTVNGNPSVLEVQANFGTFVLGHQSGNKPKYGFISVGKYINAEKMATLKTQVNTLLTALHVI